ncbi:putative secondary metabolism biosynthetic enzyme [Diaporthe australafricana]|uniref:Secondary metabolism biosynthetic enzyme n=1 Tax=Diaporthe australafricana TaxID=127596 RepID=A0ABR3XRP2_9PEZI
MALFSNSVTLKEMKVVPIAETSDLSSDARTTEYTAKTVLVMPDRPENPPNGLLKEPLRIRSDRAYLLVGDSGRFSRAVTTWLVERGVQHLVFFRGSTDNIPNDVSFDWELKEMGCTTVWVEGDVTREEDIETTASGESRWKDFEKAINVKVQGTWNLHRAFQLQQADPLDIFHLFSSLSSITGEGMGAGDAAGDAFLNAFVQYRHALGLVASCLNVDIADDSSIENETELLDCIELVLRPDTQRKQVVSGLKPDAELTQFLDGMRSSPTLLKSTYASELLAREIGAAMLGLMMRPREDLELDVPLSAMGIDSLVGLEVRNWMRRTLLVEMVAQDIVQAKNIRKLGAMAQKKLLERVEAST